jgi:hypothetical protein
MGCDHVLGSHGARFIRLSEWTETLGHFAIGVHFFHSTRLPVPHPGYVTPHAHCLDCGAKLNIAATRASLSETLTSAIDAVVGTTEDLPVETGMSLANYMSWLSVMSQPATQPDVLRVAHSRS